MHNPAEKSITFYSNRELNFNDRISSKNENTLEITVCTLNSTGGSKAIYNMQIPFSSVVNVMKIGCCLSIPFTINQKPCLLNL
jgi:hypothetical protein